MISIYKRMNAEPEGKQFAVYTTSIKDTRVRIGAFDTLPQAEKFIAKRTRGAFFCPTHQWMVCNPHEANVCPGNAALTDTPWIKTNHEVVA